LEQVKKTVSKALRQRMSEIARGCSDRKRAALRQNGSKPCKNGQRGRPKKHEVCGTPMQRIDHYHHYCPKCQEVLEYPQVYIRPERRKSFSKEYVLPKTKQESLALSGWA
jgi:hypothetical protein